MSDKKKILFVDDDKDILSGLKRTLYGSRDVWDMKFAISGNEALDMLSKGNFDIVVTDMRMPGMDGAELLKLVKEKHPNVVRIILSGHSEQEAIFKSIGPAHQYLAKPCPPKKLQTTIERASSLSAFLNNPPLQRLITQLDSLPSMPSIYIEIMEELNSENSSIDKIGKLISRDVAMSAKILQLVNSAFFGLISHVTDTTQAVHMLGLETVKSLALSVKIFSQFDRAIINLLSIEDIWKHSLAVGKCAKEISKINGKSKKAIEDSFLVGMLHDIGILVLAANLPEKYSDVIALLKEKDYTIAEAEHEIFGATHSEVGAYLLSLWGLPEEIIMPVFNHHQPLLTSQPKVSDTTLIHIADIEVSQKYPACMYGSVATPDDEYIDVLNGTDQLNEIIETCRNTIESFNVEVA